MAAPSVRHCTNAKSILNKIVDYDSIDENLSNDGSKEDPVTTTCKSSREDEMSFTFVFVLRISVKTR